MWGAIYDSHMRSPQTWAEVTALAIIDKPNGWLAFSDSYVIVDCDSPEATRRWEGMITDGVVPYTPVNVVGNRGTHFYYRNFSDIPFCKLYRDTDIISGKHGTMIAGSWHPKKQGIYEIVGALDFGSIPELVSLPDEEQGDAVRATTTIDAIISLDAASSIDHRELVGHDHRNKQLFRMAKAWVESGEADTESKLFRLISSVTGKVGKALDPTTPNRKGKRTTGVWRNRFGIGTKLARGRIAESETDSAGWRREGSEGIKPSQRAMKLFDCTRKAIRYVKYPRKWEKVSLWSGTTSTNGKKRYALLLQQMLVVHWTLRRKMRLKPHKQHIPNSIDWLPNWGSSRRRRRYTQVAASQNAM